MKKWKERFNLLKELWKDKKKRSWILLGCYFVFFIFLGIGFRTTPINNDYEVEESKPGYQLSTIISNLESLTRKDYQYELSINNIHEISGKIENGTNSFIYQGIDYIIIYEKIYSNINYQLELVQSVINTFVPIEKLTLNNVISSIKQGTFKYEQVNNNSFEIVYEVNGSYFVSAGELENIEIKLIGENEKVTKIIINYLTDNYELKIKE